MLATVKYRNSNFKIKSKINLSTVFVHCDGHYNKYPVQMLKEKKKARELNIWSSFLSTGLSTGWLSDKESACSARDAGGKGSIPGSGRFPRGGHGNSLWYSCQENPKDRGVWQVTKSQTQLKWLSTALSAIGRGNEPNIFTYG